MVSPWSPLWKTMRSELIIVLLPVLVMFRLPVIFFIKEWDPLWYSFKSGLAAVFPIFISLLSGMKTPSLAVTIPT